MAAKAVIGGSDTWRYLLALRSVLRDVIGIEPPAPGCVVADIASQDLRFLALLRVFPNKLIKSYTISTDTKMANISCAIPHLRTTNDTNVSPRLTNRSAIPMTSDTNDVTKGRQTQIILRYGRQQSCCHPAFTVLTLTLAVAVRFILF
jgi:hypothetical protein